MGNWVTFTVEGQEDDEFSPPTVTTTPTVSQSPTMDIIPTHNSPDDALPIETEYGN